MPNAVMSGLLTNARLVADAEAKFTAAGKRLLSFRVATNQYANQKESKRFFSVTLWDAPEGLEERLRKGALVALWYDLKFRDWVDKQGVVREELDLSVNSRGVLFLDDNRAATQTRSAAPAPPDDLPWE